MKCKVCGKENPENVDLCISCGSTLSRTAGETTYTKAHKVQYQCHFRESWREFVKSPIAILFILCFSAGMLCSWFEGYADILRIEMALGSIKIWSMSLLPYRKLILAGLYILVMLPNTLTVVGVWMIFADVRHKPDHPIHPGGLKLILIVQATQMIIAGIFLCISLFMAGRAFLVMLVVAGLTMALYWLIVAMIISARNASQYCMPNTSYAKALAVIQFIVAIVDVLNFLSGKEKMTLSGILSCVATAVLGAVLLKYRELMAELDAKRAEIEAQYEETSAKEQKAATDIPMPAWKRVQMEKDNSEE